MQMSAAKTKCLKLIALKKVPIAMIVILGLALLCRLSWVFFIAPEIPNALGGMNWARYEYIDKSLYTNPYGKVSPDFNQCYYPYSISILNGKGFSARDGKPTAYVGPLYSALLAVLFFVFGESLEVIRFAQVWIDLFSCLMVYFVARKLMGNKVALLSSFLYAIYPLLIYQSGLLLTETLFTFLILLFLNLLQKTQAKGENNIYPLLCGITLGLATLTRPNTLLLPLIVVPWLIYHFKSDYRESLWKSCYLILGMLLSVGPWILRNYILFKKFIPVSGIIYHFYEDPRGTISEYAIKTGLIEFVKQKILILLDDPAGSVSIFITALFTIWCKTNTGNFDLILKFIQYPLLVLAIYGAYIAIRKRRETLFLILFITYYVFTLIIISKSNLARYVVPIMPLILIFVSVAGVHIWYAHKKHERDKLSG